MKIYLKTALLSIYFLLSLSLYGGTEKIYFDNYCRKTKHKSQAKFYSVRTTLKDSLNHKIISVKDFYINDTLQMEGAYTSLEPEVKEGYFIFYFENGRKESEIMYKNNKRQGEGKYYYKSGALKKILQFNNDTILKRKEWYEEGAVYKMAEYKNGELNGKYYVFYPDGKLIRFHIFENGDFKQGNCYTKSGQDTSFFPEIIEPSFPGGEKKLREFVVNEMRLAEVYFCHRIMLIYLKVTVDTEGNLIRPQFRITDDCVIAALIKLIEDSPKWIPGKENGITKEMETGFYVPIDNN